MGKTGGGGGGGNSLHFALPHNDEKDFMFPFLLNSTTERDRDARVTGNGNLLVILSERELLEPEIFGTLLNCRGT